MDFLLSCLYYSKQSKTCKGMNDVTNFSQTWSRYDVTNFSCLCLNLLYMSNLSYIILEETLEQLLLNLIWMKLIFVYSFDSKCFIRVISFLYFVWTLQFFFYLLKFKMDYLRDWNLSQDKNKFYSFAAPRKDFLFI